MSKIRQLLSLACMAGLIYGLPTMGQAGIITLGDGSQYEIKLDSHQGNTWTYFVKELSGKDLSHWNVGIKACMDKGAVVSTSPKGDVKDGSTSFEGMKWDVGGGFTEGRFSITLNADYPKTTIKAQAKAGKRGNERTGNVMGPDCMAEPSEPNFLPPSFIPEEPEVCDFYYGVHDEGLNDSQFFTVDPNNGFDLAALPLYHRILGTNDYIYSEVLDGYDIEAIDVDLEDEIYVASGDNSLQPGHLYWVDMLYEELVEVCQTDYAEVDGISFNPADGSLWGWAQDVGLFQMTDLENCVSQVVFPSDGEFEDLTWNNTGSKLYVALNDHGAYNHIRPYLQPPNDPRPADPENDAKVPHLLLGFNSATGSISEVCRTVVDGKEIEALEMLPDGKLMLGYHDSNGEAILAVVDPTTCELTKEGSPTYNITAQKPFGDIEALGACIDDGNVPPFCTSDIDSGWMYVADSTNDATGLPALEIYGMAIRQQGDTITVAINANLDPNGITEFPGLSNKIIRRIKDGHVGLTDLVFDFGGNKYAVHFADNDSGVTALGLYENVTLKDVAKENAGFDTLNSYKAHAANPSLGDISWSGNYFEWDTRWSVPMSIASGDKVSDLTSLTAADLAGMGLDFATGLGTSLGTYTFGFSFTKAAGMEGDFTAYLFTECRNDGLGMIRQLPICE